MTCRSNDSLFYFEAAMAQQETHHCLYANITALEKIYMKMGE